MSRIQRGPAAFRQAIRRSPLGRALTRRRTRTPDRSAVPVSRIVPEQEAPAGADFPAARYVIIVESIPRRYAGRTGSILAKTKLFAEAAGVRTEIVVTGYSAELPLISSESAARGQRDPRVSLHNLYDWLEDDSTAPGPPAESRPEDPEFDAKAGEDEGTVTYFLDGVARVTHTLDQDGRLLVRLVTDAGGAPTLREDFDANGVLRHRCSYAPGERQPTDELHYRLDGTLASHRTRRPKPEQPNQREDCTRTFDRSGAVTATYRTYGAFVQHVLGRRFGTDPTFLTVEARMVDPWLIGWELPTVKQIYVLHNTHLKAPYTDVHAITPSFRGILAQHASVGATVFLTPRQRADAEQHYGQSPNWVVIPHAARPVAKTQKTVRDPNLVVMFTRLESQKQLSHAVRVMEQVVRELPEARLEIYGRGPDRDSLLELIDRLGLAESVRLCGYTTDPDAILQRASLSLLTSRYEGLPLVLAECMANGCPLISYDVTYGPSDMITSGVNGILVEPGNVTAMAESVIRALRDEPLRTAMAERGLSTIDSYTGELLVARWAQLFQTLASDGGRPRPLRAGRRPPSRTLPDPSAGLSPPCSAC